MGKGEDCIFWGDTLYTAYSPAGGYLCYFEFAHSSIQTKLNTKQDIYLKDIIWRYHVECENGEN